jgi:putative flippase GtrA
VGVVNTAIHWVSFFILTCFGLGQALANLIAFFIAVTFSFFANGSFTFKSKVTLRRYLLFISFMGFLAFSFGFIGEQTGIHGIVTLILFSTTSLVVGFLFSKLVVFKRYS